MKTMLFASFCRPPAPLAGSWSKTIILSLLLSSAFGAGPALANDASDVAKLLRSKQYAEALAKTDATLAKHPRDAQMRFYKGLILAEQNKSIEAIAIFTKLTEDFPDLPEPYNNLAVLYAANGQYEKAGATLDMAIHTNPTYATALANLGDVYARMASQAYEKALQLEPDKTSNASRLTLVRTLSGNGSGGAIPKATGNLVAPQPKAPAISKPEPVQPPKAELPPLAALEKPVEKPTVKPAEKPPEKAAEKAVANAPEKPAAKSAEKPAEKSDQAEAKAKAEAKVKAETEAKAAAKAKAEAEAKAAAEAKAVAKAKADAEAKVEAKAEANRAERERNEALALVNNWARAWSNKDVKTYLAQYDAGFQPPKSQSRKQWAEERRARIEEKARISVKIENPKVIIKGTTATVRFRQSYEADKLKINATKTLVLIRQGNRWVIVQERAG